MITHGRGQFCMPILPEAAAGFSSGRWSSETRPRTRRRSLCRSTTLVPHGHQRPGAGADHSSDHRPGDPADDLVRPGHLFPLVAKEGGVLRRAGHTEATVDLARLAGLAPAGVLCEVLDGTGRGQPRAAPRDRAGA